MTNRASESRAVIGALTEANRSLTIEVALANDGLAQANAALTVAITHISALERENTQYRKLTAEMSRAVSEFHRKAAR